MHPMSRTRVRPSPSSYEPPSEYDDNGGSSVYAPMTILRINRYVVCFLSFILFVYIFCLCCEPPSEYDYNGGSFYAPMTIQRINKYVFYVMFNKNVRAMIILRTKYITYVSSRICNDDSLVLLTGACFVFVLCRCCVYISWYALTSDNSTHQQRWTIVSNKQHISCARARQRTQTNTQTHQYTTVSLITINSAGPSSPMGNTVRSSEPVNLSRGHISITR
jgi:hypothetical protein